MFVAVQLLIIKLSLYKLKQTENYKNINIITKNSTHFLAKYTKTPDHSKSNNLKYIYKLQKTRLYSIDIK